MHWYGVKTLYRIVARGRPRKRDARYDATAALVEERVVLFRAKTFDEAIRKAEQEARAYAAGGVRINPYGQRLLTKYLACCDAFWLFETPGNRAEVFSSTEVVNARLTPRALVDARMPRESRRQTRIRKKFLNRDLLGSTAQGA